MYIFGQKEETLVNTENIPALCIDVQGYYTVDSIRKVVYLEAREGGYVHHLGKFKSYENAQKIFREIVEAITNGNPTYRIPQEGEI